MSYSLYRRWQPNPFHPDFVWQHKGGAAAQARLVQMILMAQAGKKCYIDSDGLLLLDKLFDTVRSFVRHLIVYLTQQILTRPWCAGEIVTSHKNMKMVTAVKTPEYESLGDEQLANLEAYLDLSSVNVLEYGISIEDIRNAYKWMADSVRCVELQNPFLGCKNFEVVVERILIQRQP